MHIRRYFSSFLSSPSAVRVSQVMKSQDSNGFVSAGEVLRAVDLCAARSAMRHCKSDKEASDRLHAVTTLSFDRVDFQNPLLDDELLILDAHVVRTGRTSMLVYVEGQKQETLTREYKPFLRSLLTFVGLDENHRPSPVPCTPKICVKSKIASWVDSRKNLQIDLENLEAEARRQATENISVCRWKSAQLGGPFNETMSIGNTKTYYSQMFLPKSLNVNGGIFGGDLLAWMERSARHCARVFARSETMKTISMSEVLFLTPIFPIDLVECTSRIVLTTHHTVHVECEVNVKRGLAGKSSDGQEESKSLSHRGHFVIANFNRAARLTKIMTALELEQSSNEELLSHTIARLRSDYMKKYRRKSLG